jgi:hypothetical protein
MFNISTMWNELYGLPELTPRQQVTKRACPTRHPTYIGIAGVFAWQWRDTYWWVTKPTSISQSMSLET